MTDERRQRRDNDPEDHSNKLIRAIKNGSGTVITRLLIMGMPFAFAAAIWAGKLIIELEGEKILTAIQSVDRKVDDINGIVTVNTGRINRLETGQVENSARIDGLRQRFDDNRGHR